MESDRQHSSTGGGETDPAPLGRCTRCQQATAGSDICGTCVTLRRKDLVFRIQVVDNADTASYLADCYRFGYRTRRDSLIADGFAARAAELRGAA
jgi:hypothetical protein